MTFLGYFHLAFFGAGIPFLAWRSKRRMAAGGGVPHFGRYALLMVANLVVFGGVSIVTAAFEWIELFPRRVPSLTASAAGAIVLVVMIVFMRPRWRRAVEKRASHLPLFVPQGARQRTLWIVISTLAGISEEITWRGVQFVLLARITGNALAAAILCAASFAIGHVLQGWRSVVVVFVFALVFQSLAWLAGSLYVAMGAHLLYDVVAGLTYSKLARELTPP